MQGKLTRKPILGDSLPACVVYERGEPLNEWCARSQPDTLAVLRMLCSVTQRVADLHSAGFAHRDIKPSNILWHPRTVSWAVSDFGCSAPLGTLPFSCHLTLRKDYSWVLKCDNLEVVFLEKAPSQCPCMLHKLRMHAGYSMCLTDCRVYVPPETLTMLDRKQEPRSTTVTTAADVWALGVLAVETLSGSVSAAAFAPVDTPATTTIATNACDTQCSLQSSLAGVQIHGEFAQSKTVSVCDAVHDDHATHVTQQLYAQLSGLNLASDVSGDPNASLASAMSTLRMRIAACIARDPEQRPSVTHVLAALQRARDQLQSLHACSGAPQLTNKRVPSYDSLLYPSTVVQQASLSPRQPLSHPQHATADARSMSKPRAPSTELATGTQTPTYMPDSPEVTYTHDVPVETATERHACGAKDQHTRRSSILKVKGPSIAPEVLAAQLTTVAGKQSASSVHACAPKVVADGGDKMSTGSLASTNGTPVHTPDGMLPLEVTTDGSAADDSPDSLQRRPSNFKLAQKEMHAAVPGSASDTSSSRSHTGACFSTFCTKDPIMAAVSSSWFGNQCFRHKLAASIFNRPGRIATCTHAGMSAISGSQVKICLLYTSPSPRDRTRSRMPSSA